MPPPESRRDDTPDPGLRDLSRRAGTSLVGIWTIVLLILIGAAAVYAVSAIL